MSPDKDPFVLSCRETKPADAVSDTPVAAAPQSTYSMIDPDGEPPVVPSDRSTGEASWENKPAESQPVHTTNATPVSGGSKSKKKLIVIIAAVVLVLLGAGGASAFGFW